ncbi:MAG: hypothetical protein K6G80_01635 [Treponema sp.]|nr:hypothetical protein [Treponema sp.]
MSTDASLENKLVLLEASRQDFDRQLESFAYERARELNKAFVWSEENKARFRELDEFLREKQRLLYRTVESALASAKNAVQAEPDFLGGEVEIKGRLMISDPYNEALILPGLSEPVFSAMVVRANRWTYDLSCSTYHPLEPYDGEMAENACYFPEGSRNAMQVCYAFYALFGSRMFAFQDLLNLNRELFTCSVRMENHF